MTLAAQVKAVISALRRKAGLTKEELAAATKLTAAQVQVALNMLTNTGRIREQVTLSAGRKASHYRLRTKLAAGADTEPPIVKTRKQIGATIDATEELLGTVENGYRQVARRIHGEELTPVQRAAAEAVEDWADRPELDPATIRADLGELREKQRQLAPEPTAEDVGRRIIASNPDQFQ